MSNVYENILFEPFLLVFPPLQVKRRPLLLQASPPLQSGAGAPPEPLGVPRTPLAHVRQEEGGLSRQSERPASQQLAQQQTLVVTVRLQGEGRQQDQVPPRQAEQLQVRPPRMALRSPRIGSHPPAAVVLLVEQGEGKRQPLRRRQPSPPPLSQLLAHSQTEKRFAQFHGGTQDHQVTHLWLTNHSRFLWHTPSGSVSRHREVS